MNNFEKYSLELKKYANNCNNKRQDYKHIIKEDVDSIYKNTDFSYADINETFDAMGDEDLIKYEKWLINGRF